MAYRGVRQSLVFDILAISADNCLPVPGGLANGFANELVSRGRYQLIRSGRRFGQKPNEIRLNGIRDHGLERRPRIFKTGALNRSATHPLASDVYQSANATGKAARPTEGDPGRRHDGNVNTQATSNDPQSASRAAPGGGGQDLSARRLA